MPDDFNGKGLAERKELPRIKMSRHRDRLRARTPRLFCFAEAHASMKIGRFA